MVSHPVCSSFSYQLAHQVIRRYETYRIRAHVCLLLGPPALVVAHISSSQAQPAFALFTTFLSALASYLAALATSIILYRLSPFHPLAQYPGPVWRRVSMLGPAAVAATGNRHRVFADMHRKYGDVIRTGLFCPCFRHAPCTR